jgi:uncharacterized protein (DUF2267 family)
MMETRTQWIEGLRAIAPFADDDSASRALVATLEALAALLTRDERQSLSRHLPSELGALVLATRPRIHDGPGGFFHQVATREGTRPGVAVEHAELVCRFLGQMIPFEVRTRLERALPELKLLFARPEAFEPPPRASEPRRDVPNDLAEGRPGSRHPLASSDPLVTAHRHSVARSADPHADTKLSSATGFTQEREGDTLAGGRPGSTRPISGSH